MSDLECHEEEEEKDDQTKANQVMMKHTRPNYKPVDSHIVTWISLHENEDIG